MAKVAVHLFHDDDDSLRTGSRVAQRMQEVAAARAVELEVFCFGPAQAKLSEQHAGDESAVTVYNRQIDELIADGVPVTACVNAASGAGQVDALTERGFALEVARDVFLRFALEGATVLAF